MTKINQSPKVSIILPAYNAARYIEESIQSVLRQDYQDYELIIINDGSTDDTQSIVNKYSQQDPRIVPINQKNHGLVATLNKGLSLAKGEYIARIDGDDPWMDCKLSLQVAELDRDPNLVLIGGGFEVIDEDGYYIETIFPPTDDQDIRRSLMLRNVFGHAGVVFRKSAVEATGHYSDAYGPTEDYDLWIRLAKVGAVMNLPNPVYRYRINRTGISQQNSFTQATETKKHIEKQWADTFPLVLSRAEIQDRAQHYLSASKRDWYNIALKEQFLSDNAQVGIKLLRYKKYAEGARQLFNVASTGRTGVRAVIKRLKKLDRGSFKQRQHVTVERDKE